MAQATLPKPDTILSELQVIAEQVAQAGQVDAGRKQLAGRLRKLSEFVTSDEQKTYLFDIDVTPELVDNIASTFNQWADALNPTATVTWKSEEVQAKLAFLTSLAQMGVLTEEQQVELKATTEKLNTKASRGAPQPGMPGRPEWVVTTTPRGETVSKQRGNVASSASNIRNTAKSYFERNKIVFNADQLLAAINLVTKEGNATATYNGLTFTAQS